MPPLKVRGDFNIMQSETLRCLDKREKTRGVGGGGGTGWAEILLLRGQRFRMTHEGG
jgi:hypothetical protein